MTVNVTLCIAGYGKIHYHISNGGNYYIYTDVTQFGLDITSSPGSDLIVTAGKLKAAVADSIKLSHPENGSPAKLTGVFFYSNPLSNSSDAVSELCIYEKMVSCCITHTVTTDSGHQDYPSHLGYFFSGLTWTYLYLTWTQKSQVSHVLKTGTWLDRCYKITDIL